MVTLFRTLGLGVGGMQLPCTMPKFLDNNLGSFVLILRCSWAGNFSWKPATMLLILGLLCLSGPSVCSWLIIAFYRATLQIQQIVACNSLLTLILFEALLILMSSCCTKIYISCCWLNLRPHILICITFYRIWLQIKFWIHETASIHKVLYLTQDLYKCVSCSKCWTSPALQSICLWDHYRVIRWPDDIWVSMHTKSSV